MICLSNIDIPTSIENGIAAKQQSSLFDLDPFFD